MVGSRQMDGGKLEEAVIAQLRGSKQGLEVDDLIAQVAKVTGETTERVQEVVWGLIDARRVSVGWDTKLRNPAQAYG
jgi:hypothetical protein